MATPSRPRFAVIGHPIAHSRSPAIHAAFGAALGIDLQYGRIDCPPDDFKACVQQFFAQGGSGLNVTVPFKEQAWQLAQQHLSPRARDAQAVNTLWMDNGSLHGCNTDGVGLVNDFKRLALPLEDANILLLGAGGAARGVIGPLMQAGCRHIHVVNRTAARALALASDWIATHPEAATRLSAGGLSELGEYLAIPDTNKPAVIINATASSLQGDALPLPGALFGPDVVAYDMMYASGLTKFLQQAQAAGCQRLVDGLGMLVGQAAESFRIWLGQTPDTEMVIAQIRAQLDAAVR